MFDPVAMSTLTVNYLDVIERLPAGALLRLQDVSWDEYEYLLTQMEAHSGHRLTYDRGRLTIMSPRHEHEYYKEFVLSFARVLAEETGLPLETGGATTFKNKALAQGVEPDTCFYVQSAAHIIGNLKPDLKTDPPPDVVVEIDTTNFSLDKFHIYVALGVPEIWRYDGKQARFYYLAESGYEEMSTSRAFPSLAASMLADYIEQSKTEGQTASLAAFRQKIRSGESA
jgi:Uma2 family endonuclease